MTYKIISSDEFDKKLNKLDYSIKQRLIKIKERLKLNPYIGKPLVVEYFRELKINKFRFYYLIYENYKIVKLATISEKKDQQRTICAIKLFLDIYKQEIEDYIKKRGS